MNEVTLLKLIKIRYKLQQRIGTPHEKWGDRRKLRRLKRITGERHDRTLQTQTTIRP